jgi:hypothetical protein
MTQVEKQLGFDTHSAPAAPTIKTLVLFTALLAYAAGFVVLASSVAASGTEGESPALIQFVGP